VARNEKEDLRAELEDWLEGVNLGFLRQLYIILANHRDHSYKEALRLLRGHQDREAGEQRAIGADMDHITNLIKTRIETLKKELGKGGD